jgi:hypothetical protein
MIVFYYNCPFLLSSQVPEALKRSSNFEGQESYFPDRNTLQKYRVIVCTLICAGRLVNFIWRFLFFFNHEKCEHLLNISIFLDQYLLSLSLDWSLAVFLLGTSATFLLMNVVMLWRPLHWFPLLVYKALSLSQVKLCYLVILVNLVL